MLIRKYAAWALVGLLLGGCAVTVKKDNPSTAGIRVGSDAAKSLVLNMTGSKDSTESTDWEPFKGIWRQAMKEETAAIGAGFAAQEGDPKSTGEPGTLLVVDVADFRLLSAAARYGLGIMIGNAFVVARVSFRDLKTGETWGEQNYDTTSTAWQGIFSPMTEKQVRAICKQIVADLSKH